MSDGEMCLKEGGMRRQENRDDKEEGIMDRGQGRPCWKDTRADTQRRWGNALGRYLGEMFQEEKCQVQDPWGEREYWSWWHYHGQHAWSRGWVDNQKFRIKVSKVFLSRAVKHSLKTPSSKSWWQKLSDGHSPLREPLKRFLSIGFKEQTPF